MKANLNVNCDDNFDQSKLNCCEVIQKQQTFIFGVFTN